MQYVKDEYEKLAEELSKPGMGFPGSEGFSEDALLWTFGILRSRTFAPLTGDDLALVPFADLVSLPEHRLVLLTSTVVSLPFSKAVYELLHIYDLNR